MASLSVEEENYIRMSLLLTGISKRVTRKLFDSEFSPRYLSVSLRKEYNKLLFLKTKHLINRSQWNLLFPRYPHDPKSKTFDITLMITLLRNIKNITNSQGGFGCLPTDMETTPGADLAKIEYYRNYLAQLDGGKVRSIDFNTAWDIITGAIGRLGGQIIKQYCDHLRIRTLDQTNKEIIEDIKCSNDEIKNLKASLNSLKIYHELLLEGDHRERKRSYEELQEDHTEMTDEIKRLKTSYDDTVPCNLRARFKETLTAWKENDDKMFINTRAAKLVFKCIKEHNCVTITASSGEGKTATLRHVALQMAEEEFNVLLVTEPCDIVRFYNPREKILFVIDD